MQILKISNVHNLNNLIAYSYYALLPICFVAALLGARFRDTSTMLGGSSEDGDIGVDEFPPASVMGRRRSRAVLYQLSGHYKPEKVKTKLKINNVSIFVL